jgi:excisionase family DNA binding protein
MKLLTTEEAAEYLCLSPSTIRQFRSSGGGPLYYRLGRGMGAQCRYRTSDLDAWLAERRFSKLSDEEEKDGDR